MATPRSVKGFEEAIAAVEAQIGDLDQQLQEAEAGSSQEEDLLADKAEASVELETLKQKFVEFNEREAEKEAAKEDTPQEEDKPKEAEPAPKQEESWPDTVYVAVRNDIGFMVNPYTHFKHTTGFQKVATDKWTISQIKAGFLLVDKD
ncbi:hypothetical protein VPHK449_0108 [Vibrio phage K449]|nr:hypothetical protein SIPHO049v1_p0088 [Vibrio phage PS14A.1]